MVEKGIIELWRIRAYIRKEGQNNPDTYDYDKDDGKWLTYDREKGKWVNCPDPFNEK